MIMSNSIKVRIKEIIEEVLRVSISDSDGIGTIPEWDSMAQLNILIEIESVYSIKFKMSDLTSVVTYLDWVNLLEITKKAK